MPAVIGASAVLGAIAGIAYEKLKKDEGDEYGKILDEEGYEFPDIPEGVNLEDDIEERKLSQSKLFVKPDLSKYVDYTKYQKHADEEEADDEEQEHEDFIFQITEEEFVRQSGNGDGYVTATATWFTQDHILAGWNDDLLEREPSETVGQESVDMFDDPAVKAVYVRNENLKVLFEVVRCDDPMEEVIQESLVMASQDGA